MPTPHKARPDPQKSLVGFAVGDVSYAVPIGEVREIVNPLVLTELPHAPAAVVDASAMKTHSLYLFFPLYRRNDVSVLLLATATSPPPAWALAACPAALIGPRPNDPVAGCPAPNVWPRPP